MSNYTKTTNFATKDSLASGNPNKIVKGTEINAEFDNIATAVATKANTASPTLTGTVTAAAINVTGNVDVDGTLEFDTLSGTGSIGVTDIADEDDMSSNSATKLATQQSIKAYVDSQVTAQDLDLTDGTTSISIDLDSEALSVLGGTGIDSTASGNGVTLAIDSTVTTLTGSQTLTNKTLTSPDVNTPDIDGGTIDGTVIGGSSAAAGSFTTVGATGNITVGGTVDGRDVATDGTKLDGIEASADVTDTANVTAAGALMDSELTAIASVKALNQGVATTDSPTFAAVTVNGNVEFDGLSGTGSVTVTDILDQDDMSGNSATALATQQSIKAYVDAQQDTVDTLAEILALSNATGGTDIAVGTGDDITFADNSKAIFGTGSDLSILHDGSNSFISEQGTGDLIIGASNNIALMNAAFSENKLLATTDGALKLYFNGAEKLATASGGISVTGEVAATSLDISGDIDVDGTTNLDVVDIDGAVDMASTLAVGGVVTANAGVVVDNTTFDANKLATSSGNFFIDSASDIYLDADGANIFLRDDGTNFGNFNKNGNNLKISSSIQDGDIVFAGDDGGSAITALTLDMSAAGAATFNAGVTATGLTVDTGNAGNGINYGFDIRNSASGSGTSYAMPAISWSNGGLRWASVHGERNSAGGFGGLLKFNTMDSSGNATERLTIDAAGAATFTGVLTANAGVVVDQLTIDGGNITSSSGGMTISGADDITVNAVGDVILSCDGDQVKFDDGTSTRFTFNLDSTPTMGMGTLTLFENEIDVGSGNLTLDVAGNINLDADGGSVFFKDAGTEFFKIRNTGSDVQIYSARSDADIKIEGVDGGVGITALLLDMSAAGAATFNAGVTVGGEITGATSIRHANSNAQVIDNDNNTYFILNDPEGSNRIKIGDSGDRTTSIRNDTIKFEKADGTLVFNIASDGSLSTPTAGTSNVRFGVNAGNSIASGGNFNTVVGDEAGTAITTGDDNTFIGYAAGDATTTAGGNTAIGSSAFSTNTTGADNVAIGEAALLSNTTAATNTAVGNNALRSTTTGASNVAVGSGAGYQNITGAGNIGIGLNALYSNTASSLNVAIGTGALDALNIGSGNGYNVAVGDQAGGAVTTGVSNTLIGGLAGDALTDADNNVAVGKEALSSDTLGSRSVAIGNAALEAQNFTSATNVYNTAVGHFAGGSVTTSTNNTLIGGLAGDALTSGSLNTAVGYAALSGDTLGVYNVAVGVNALLSQNFTSSTFSYNTAVGTDAGKSVTTGTLNTLIGGLAGDALTTGQQNVALGYTALSADDVGNHSVAIGTGALLSQNYGSATNSYNTAVGSTAGASVTTGTENTLIGGLAGDALTDADSNVAIGVYALTSDTLGSRAVAIGRGALSTQNFTSATESYNVAIGYQTGGAVTTGTQNTFLGGLVGDAFTTGGANVGLGYACLTSDTKGNNSVAIGRNALLMQNFTTATDVYNTAVGSAAGQQITTGLQNTLIGGLAGDTLTTGSLNVALGYNVDFGAIGRARSIGIGNNFTVSGDDRIQIGNGSNIATLLLNGSATTWSASSDERLKENIETSTAGLSFINDLRPVTYNWKKAKDVLGELPQHIEGSDEPCLGHTYGALKHGFIAQEVKTVIDNHSEVKDGQEIWQIDDTNVQALAPSALVPMLVKAIQELSAQVDALTARIETLEG